jgi:hypothetical protein
MFGPTCAVIVAGNLNGNCFAVDCSMLKSVKYLGGKSAVCFKQGRVPHNFNLADSNAPNTGNSINRSNQALGHNPVTPADIKKKTGKLLLAVFQYFFNSTVEKIIKNLISDQMH